MNYSLSLDLKCEVAFKIISNSVSKKFTESKFLNLVFLEITSAGPLLSVSVCR